MSRTPQQIIEAELGSLVMRLSILTGENELLKEENDRLKMEIKLITEKINEGK